jgi:hypothetical protein
MQAYSNHLCNTVSEQQLSVELEQLNQGDRIGQLRKGLDLVL